MQCIYIYIPETNHDCYGIQCCNYSVVTIHGAYNTISSVKSIVLLRQYFPKCMCAVLSMDVFCSSSIWCFLGIFLRCFLNDFEMFPVAPILLVSHVLL